MKLWLISQSANDNYDTYDMAVVVAVDEEGARRVHPGGNRSWSEDAWRYPDGRKADDYSHVWALPSEVSVKLIGDAAEGLDEGEVVCASFNAG